MHSTTSGALASLPEQGPPAIRRPGVLAVGQGQPVVLLHGSMSSKAQWSPLVQRLSHQFQVIAVDLHGYGDNLPPQGMDAFSVDDEIDFVRARLDAVLGRPMPVHLVGHSYGGLVALRFAQRLPAYVLSLAVYEPMVLNLLFADDPIAAPVHAAGRALTTLVGEHRVYEAAQVCIDFWSGDGTFAGLPLPAKAKMAAGAAPTALNYQAEVSCPLRLDDVRSIRAPALVLGGAHSPEAAQRIVRMLAAALPNTSANWLNTNHTGPVTASELVNPWISTFLEVEAAKFCSKSTGAGRSTR